MTKRNHCIWPIRTHYTFVSTNEQFAPNEDSLAMVQRPSTITILYTWSLGELVRTHCSSLFLTVSQWLTSDLIHESWVKISLSVKQCEVIILWWSCSSISDTDYTPQRISIQIKIDFIHSLHTWFLFTCLMLTDVSPPSAQCHCVSSRSKII